MAQEPDADLSAARRGAWELWGGIGNRSPQWGILGETPDMRLGLIALRWTRPIGARTAADELPVLEWHIDLVPLARLSPPLVSLRGSGVPCQRAALCVLPPDSYAGTGLFPPGAPSGFGVSPLGLTRRFHRAGPISPWLGITGGALFFSERVPTTQASRFNFTASGELGLRFGAPTEPGITVAYRFHHISNGGTAGENPGVASHLITVGIHRPRH
jgi:Lipid A 3-O-deacylase (PagL)